MLFYLKTVEDEIFVLDATEEFSFSEAGSLTEYALESGAKASDHYVNENKSFSLSGVISDFKSGTSVNRLGTDRFIAGLLKAKQDKTPLTLYFRENSSAVLDNFFDNLMITNVNFSQNAENGHYKGYYSYKVSIDLKQIIFAQKAVITQGTALSNKTSDKKKSTATTTDTGDIRERGTPNSGGKPIDPSLEYTYDMYVRTFGGQK